MDCPPLGIFLKIQLDKCLSAMACMQAKAGSPVFNQDIVSAPTDYKQKKTKQILFQPFASSLFFHEHHKPKTNPKFDRRSQKGQTRKTGSLGNHAAWKVSTQCTVFCNYTGTPDQQSSEGTQPFLSCLHFRCSNQGPKTAPREPLPLFLPLEHWL